MGQTIAVIAGGDILDYPTVAKELTGLPVICADGGYHHCEPLGIVPDLVVGDFDSLDTLPASIPHLVLPVDKDYTDSVFAVEEARRREPEKILLYGMLGGRIDHSLANLALLADTAACGYDTVLSDGKAHIYPLVSLPGKTRTRYRFPPKPGHYFSLISYSEVSRGVSLSGGKYPLEDYTLTHRSARAVSNEFTQQPVTIEFATGLLFYITTPHDTL